MIEIANFFRLKNAKIGEVKDSNGLDTIVLEEEMRENNGGIVLSRIKGEEIRSDSQYLRFVPYFCTDSETRDMAAIKKLANRYPKVNGPSAMLVSSIEELERHMSVGYQTAHFHYILGKKNNLKGRFPNLCCGISSRNVTLSLLDKGYANAAYAYSNMQDHGYSMLPFILEEQKLMGSIIIDPTSDQLWRNRDKRNAVFIKLGTEWKYETDWNSGANLFPDRICSVDTLRKCEEDIADLSFYHVGGKKYLERAFSNPIRLEI